MYTYIIVIKMSNAVGCGFDHRSGQTKKDQDMFLLMSKTNKKKSESDYKCCKLEILEIRVCLPRRGFVGLCGLLLVPSL